MINRHFDFASNFGTDSSDLGIQIIYVAGLPYTHCAHKCVKKGELLRDGQLKNTHVRLAPEKEFPKMKYLSLYK